MKGCFFIKESEIEKTLYYFYGNGRMEQIKSMLEICDEVITENNLEKTRNFLRECEVLFCTWEMVLTEEQLCEYFPNLKIIFSAAATALPGFFLRQGVRVVTSRFAMAYPVALYAASMIALANKAAFFARNLYKEKGYEEARMYTSRNWPGTYETKTGILGVGAIGEQVIKLLEPYKTQILAYDPYLSDERANELGVKKTDLEEIFSQCQTISNHMANKPETVGMLNYKLFSIMKDNAAFVNTGRGPQIVEEDLVRALREKPDRYAVLDVTYPEPVPDNNPFLFMPNVFLTPHIAGFEGNEASIVADNVIEEFKRYRDGLPLHCEITEGMLSALA